MSQTISKARYTLTQGVVRPGVARAKYRQNVILFRDCSSSMDGDKAAAAKRACSEFVAELAKNEGFSVAIVDFNDTAKEVMPLTSASGLLHGIPDLNVWGDTNITGAIKMGSRILGRTSVIPEGYKQVRHVGVLFTDGLHNVGPGPQNAADEFKRTADLVTVAFGNDADETMLREIATSPSHFYRVSNGAELMRFMQKLGTTLTQTIARGVPATHALATM